MLPSTGSILRRLGGGGSARKRRASVTTLPYVAPWQTGFARYATLSAPVVATAASPTSVVITVPDGQWWRLISLSVGFSCGAGAATRTVSLALQAAGATSATQLTSPVTVVASGSGIAMWMPNGSAFASTTVPGGAYGLSPLPDVLWQYGSTFTMQITPHVATDAINTNGSILYEVYTEERHGVLVPAAPTPVLV